MSLRVIRPAFNVLLSAGYVFGLLLVWTGFETLTIERGSLVAGLFSIGCGLATWTALNFVGRLPIDFRSGRRERAR